MSLNPRIIISKEKVTKDARYITFSLVIKEKNKDKIVLHNKVIQFGFKKKDKEIDREEILSTLNDIAKKYLPEEQKEKEKLFSDDINKEIPVV